MWIYNLVIRCYALLIHLSAFRNLKARQWVQGRKQWRKKLETQLSSLGNSPRVWMHCASYGEFEQGRPLLEAIKSRFPDTRIILSFFSPSGYEAFKNWQGADVVCYLPFDSKANARVFIQLVKPEQVIFIKYEFWLNFLRELKRSKASAFLVSAVFKPHHPFFRWYGGIFKDSLSAFKTIFVQDASSLKLLQKAGINNAIISGDTRFDRVMQIQAQFEALPFFESHCKGHQVIVAGSTWASDEDFLLKGYAQLKTKKPKLILVPHEVDKKSISDTEARLKSAGLSYRVYSEVKDRVEASTSPSTSSGQRLSTRAEEVLVIDTIGLLSRLYHYADIAYIGGGFDSGIHNLLEPAVHLKPIVFFGQADYSKYNEAIELIEIGAAKAVLQTQELVQVLDQFLDNKTQKVELEKNIKSYFEARSGSTQKVMEQVFGKA
jgi:3-deoxy-D-manno-octulosonic-acid transferase